MISYLAKIGKNREKSDPNVPITSSENCLENQINKAFPEFYFPFTET
jgi:hypothetical protein